MIRVPIDVYCDHPDCGRMTKASAWPEDNGSPFGGPLRYHDVRFPADAQGNASLWTYNDRRGDPYRGARCPDHRKPESP